ncbi:MAG TPA: helix-hairpin-helix domain-containing protein [bacterium]|nr:helix-hairpin-helix domain-containing protein [bacterium]HOL47143.1 helix-hairpin-helix domain-containing protein [bacterium]HPQ18066.1 helix-hairpin-helix domain-containing protein [bacterium]
MKKIIFTLIICLFVFYLFATELAKFWFEAANNTDDPILKELYLLRAIKEEPNYMEAYKALGLFYYSHGKMDKAKQYLEFLPKQKITLPEERVITIVKPEEVKETPEQQMIKKLDEINQAIKSLTQKIEEKKEAPVTPPVVQQQPTSPPAVQEVTAANKEILNKFDQFAGKIEKMFDNQNTKIETLNKNYSELVENLNNQNKLIIQLSEKTTANSKNIDELNIKVEKLFNEVNILKDETQKTKQIISERSVAAPVIAQAASTPVPAPVPAPAPIPAPVPVQPKIEPQPQPVPAPKKEEVKPVQPEIVTPPTPTPVPVPSPVPVPAPVQPAPAPEVVAPPKVEPAPRIEEVRKPAAIKKVNINTANENELTTLPTINNVEAILIVKYRERYGTFKSIEDIKRVPGLGKKYDTIKDYITVGEEEVAPQAITQPVISQPTQAPAPAAPVISAPAPVQAPVPSIPAAPATVSTGKKLDINTATVDDLVNLGKLSKLDCMLIVRYRERYGKFKTIEEIKEVPGIDDVKFSQIKDLVEVR